jgi:UDP-glucose 4-epimerase
MNIIVTGGLGYIGSHTVIELINNNYNVIIIDNCCNSSINTLDLIHTITGVLPQYYNIDLCNKHAVLNIQNGLPNIDCIIHFAALKSVAQSVQDPLLYYNNNVCSLLNIIELAKGINCKNFIFSSSATLYPPTASVPLVETAPAGAGNNRYGDLLTGNNPYGTTKIIGEQILHDIADADPTWSIKCLRYFNPAGYHYSGLIGEDFKGNQSYINLFPTILYNKYFNKTFTVLGNDYNTSDGTPIRDYIHAMDVATAHMKSIELKTQGCISLNIGLGVGLSVLDILNEFNKQGFNIEYNIGPRRKGDAECIYADCKRFHILTNWTPKYNLQDMVRDTIKYYEMNAPI